MLTLNLLNNSNKILKGKKPIHIILPLILFVSSLSGCDYFAFKTRSKTIIQVEDQNISLGVYSSLLADKLKTLDPLSAKDPAILKSFKNRIVTDLIIDALIEKWSEEQKLKITPENLEQELTKIISQYPNDKTFREELAKQNKSFQSWKKSVEVSLKRKALFDSLRKQIVEPSDAELQAYFQNNKSKYYRNESVLVESILLQDENQADVIKQLYKKGQSFEKLFKEYSLDKDTPAGFKYGWVERINNGSDVESLFTIKRNELIGPIQFAEGFRLFKITQRKAAYQKTFEESKKDVKNEVISLRETARFSAWLDEQIKMRKIYKNTSAIDALSVETREE
ncbi:MAG: peptidyl-prolyl cis-trans isomerase [Pseudobdellovibrio sp.]